MSIHTRNKTDELIAIIGELIHETQREGKTPRIIRLGPVERGQIAPRMVFARGIGKRTPMVLGFEIKPGLSGVSVEA